WLFDARGKIPKEPFPVRPPADTRRSALATLAAQAARQQSTGSELGPPSPALRANPFCSDRRALLLIEAWLLPQRSGIGSAIQRHPFFGLRAVGHRNPASCSSRIASSVYQKWPTWSSRFRGMAQQSSHPVLPI
ncbi:unnamed protein product, partial [Brassica rapa subsp. trilocularis]